MRVGIFEVVLFHNKSLKKQIIMKLLKSNLNLLTALLIVAFAFTSCSSDNDDNNNFNTAALAIKTKAVTNFNGLGRSINAAVDVTKFKINIKEIELEFDDDFCDDDDDDDDNNFDCSQFNGFYSGDDEIKLKGPFEVDVLTGVNTITTIDVPENVIFEEIEFEFDRNTDPSSDLFGKTILIEGTIDDVPFVFWHNLEVDIEIDYEDANQNLDISNGFNSVIIEFDLAGLFSTVNLSNATDNNGDGIIEISPTDMDGNRNLANQIKNLIKDYADLLDD